jgi:Tol biopolymer transport system component
MKPGIRRKGQSASIRPWAVSTLISFAFLLLSVALMLSGCMNEHSRSLGHGDITFVISPRGDAIVFNAVGVGGLDLYLLDMKTSRVTRIAATPDYEVDPSFSSDGKWIVYAAGKPGDRADHLFLRSLDGQTLKQLTAEDANDGSPSFSPDGSLIVFTRDKTYNWGGLASNWDAGGVLCVIRTDGTGLREIMTGDSIAIDPHFSPDGKSILFWEEDGLRLVASDGSQSPRRIDGPNGRQAVYSPDGRSIAFSMGRYAPDHRIFLAAADGTGSRKLAHPGEGRLASPGEGCFRPAFTPDGSRILFFLEDWPDGPTGVPKESLWEAGVEGGKPREIAGYALFDDPLNWRPAPPAPTIVP